MHQSGHVICIVSVKKIISKCKKTRFLANPFSTSKKSGKMPWYLLGIMVLMKRCVMGLAKIAQFSFSSAWELLANQLKFLMCFLPLFFHGLYPKRYCRFTPNFCQRLPLFLGSLNSNFIKILCHV